MYLDDRTTLLPETEIPGGQETYRIEKFLGLGLTAQVYRARGMTTGRIVALKVLRHDASAVSTEHFWHEAQVLNELRAAGVPAAPELYDQQREGEFRFLALEYVQGEPLGERLEPLPEQEALEAARQALTTLQALHEQVGRTYTDMQLKNFYWNAETQTLKILDWNHVSTQRESIQPDELHGFGVETFEQLAQRDLARFGAYFYRMLTGKGALEQGETAGALARRAGAQWERISVAARQIVQRALRPAPAQRYATAAEFLTAVTALQARWRAALDVAIEEKELDDLLEAAKGATVAQPAALARLDEIDARLDLLQRRGIDLPGYRRRLEHLTQKVSQTWASGKLYYKAEQYAQAAQIWEPEAQAQGRAELWRWVMLAQSGAFDSEAFKPARAALERVVKALEKRELANAAQEWETLAAAQPWAARGDIPARWLGVEIGAAQQVEAGVAAEREGDAAQSPEAWERAAAAYQQAAADLAGIPYAALLRKAYEWQALETWIKELHLRSQTYRAANTQTVALRAALEQDFETGLKQIQEALLRTPGATEVIALCQTYADTLKSTAPEQALELLDTLLFASIPNSTWAEQRAELQRAKKHWESAAAALGQIAAALTDADWPALRQAAQALPAEAHSIPRYAGVLAQVQEAYQTRLDSGDLAAAQQLDAALTALGDASAERTQALQTLQHQQLQTELAAHITAIKAALDQQDFAAARQYAERIPAEMRREEAYLQLATEAQTAYEAQLPQSLWEAQQWHGFLTALGAGDAAARQHQLRAQEETLQTRAQTLAQQVQELENQDSELRKALAKGARLQLFRTSIESQAQQWQAKLNAEGPAAYPTVLEEVKTAIGSSSELYQDLADEELYQQWQTYLQERKTWLEGQIAADKESATRLDTAEQHLKTARQQANTLTLAALKDAQATCRQASAQLAYAPPEQHHARHTQLQAQAQALATLVAALAQTDVIEAVTEAQRWEQEFERHYKQPQDAQALRTTFEAFAAARNKARTALGRETWALALAWLPTIKQLDDHYKTWEPWYPLSGGGPSQEVVLIASLDPKDLKKLQDALTTAETNITSHVDTSLQPLSDRVAQLEKQSRGPARWMPWALSGAALLLSLALLAAFLIPLGPLQKVQKELAAKLDNLPVATGTLQPTAPPVTPAPTEPPATATSEPPTEPTLAPPPVAEMTLAWTRGITLYAMPGLTLTLGGDWSFTSTVDANTDMTQVVALAPDKTEWEITTVVTSTKNQRIVLPGSWVISDAHMALWRPDNASPLSPDVYQVGVVLSYDQREQVVTGEAVTITPLYSTEVSPLEVYDPGLPGMSVIYRITNTGNVPDRLWLALNMSGNARFLGVSGIITLSSGITQAIGLEGDNRPLTFVSPLSDAQPPKNGLYNVLLPEISPGDALTLDLFARGNGRICPLMNFTFVPEAGTGNPIQIEEKFNNCKSIKY